MDSAAPTTANHSYLRDEELRQGIEMMFYAYRDFTAEPDAILQQFGFGRAHHRVIYFVGRYPGASVSALLAILKITKQSLNRVLGQLVREGFIVQIQGVEDRRQRLLELTEKGRALEMKLTANQRERFYRAYQEAGADAVDGFRKVILGLITGDEDRRRFSPGEDVDG